MVSTDCNGQNGDITPNNEQVGNITFINDACVSAERAHWQEDEGHSMTREPRGDSIEDYLSKPIKIGYGVIEDFRVLGSWVLTMPGLFNSHPLWQEKFKGFLGLRASLHVRVEVSASPYVCGRLKLCHLPCYNEEGTQYDRLNDRCTQSQLPGVELNYSQATAVELTIPYINTKSYINLLTNDTGFGVLYLTNYFFPLVPPGGVRPTFSVYLSFKDVELVHCTARDFAVITPQMGKRSIGRDPEDNQDRPVSTMLNATARVAGLVGRKVPFLSSYAAPASWALRMSAKVVAAFGFDKPNATTAPTITSAHIQPFTQNADGIDQLHNLSLLHDSRVKPTSGFGGSNLDEMAISFVIGVPASIHARQITTSAAVDGLLFSLPLSPDFMWHQASQPLMKALNVVTTPKNSPWPCVYMSPVCAVAQLFQLYRGGFKITIKFNKTIYHTGRLLLVFVPGIYGDGTTPSSLMVPSLYGSANCKRQIIDLREGNEFTFHCPFTSLEPFLPCGIPFGTLNMFVVDSMQASPNVAQLYDYSLEVAADENFVFSGVASTQWAPAPNGVTATFQSGDRSMSDAAFADAVKLAEITTGELTFSLKQVMQRPFWKDAPYDSDVWTEHYVTYTPNNAAPTAVNRNGVDHIDYISSFYTFERGGKVFRALAPDGISRITLIPAVFPNRPKVPLRNCATAFEKTNMISVYIPRYSNTNATLIRPNKSINHWSNFNPTIRYEPRNAADNATQTIYRWTRCLADDAQMGGFLGIPAMCWAPIGTDEV